MKIEFTQEGQSLRLTSDSKPVQFGDNIPVAIAVDTEYSSATEIVLLTQAYKSLPARCVLTLSGNTASGTISRAQLTECGTVNFVLAGKINDMILPTAAAKIDVLPSVDPQSAEFVQNPASIKDIIAETVGDYLNSDQNLVESVNSAVYTYLAEHPDDRVAVSGYDSKDAGKIPVVNTSGNLTVRNVHMLLEQVDGEDALVLRGAVNQIVASVSIADLKNALGIENGATVLDMYPVGSIYQTTSSAFNPAAAWGGTWERIKDRFLLAAGTAYAGGSTGGEATHKLTAQEMPSHTHTMYVNNDGSASSWSPTFGDYLIKPDGVTTSKKNYQAKLAQNGAGLDQAHNNMPPYLAVYIWKRTA